MNNSAQNQTAKILFGLFTGLMSFSLFAQAANTPSGSGSTKPLLERSKLSIGAGVSLNSVDGPVNDELGYQLFAAYKLSQVNLLEGVNSSFEVGYMDYGFDGVDNDGLWATYVIDGAISSQVNWLGRLGFDFGDDSGLMAGIGLAAPINKQLQLRMEYVVRDEVDSIQLNLIYKL